MIDYITQRLLMGENVNARYLPDSLKEKVIPPQDLSNKTCYFGIINSAETSSKEGFTDLSFKHILNGGAVLSLDGIRYDSLAQAYGVNPNHFNEFSGKFAIVVYENDRTIKGVIPVSYAGIVPLGENKN